MRFTVRVNDKKIRQVIVDVDRDRLAVLHEWLADMSETPHRNELCHFLESFLLSPDTD